jgi:hypothetical protein
LEDSFCAFIIILVDLYTEIVDVQVLSRAHINSILKSITIRKEKQVNYNINHFILFVFIIKFSKLILLLYKSLKKVHTKNAKINIL